MTVRRLVAVVLTGFVSSLLTVVTVTGLHPFMDDLILASCMTVGITVIVVLRLAWDGRRNRVRTKGG